MKIKSIVFVFHLLVVFSTSVMADPFMQKPSTSQFPIVETSTEPTTEASVEASEVPEVIGGQCLSPDILSDACEALEDFPMAWCYFIIPSMACYYDDEKDITKICNSLCKGRKNERRCFRTCKNIMDIKERENFKGIIPGITRRFCEDITDDITDVIEKVCDELKKVVKK